ncbi:MAG: cyclic nucleotide-binding domain-containing protein [Azoarcus sp.]
MQDEQLEILDFLRRYPPFQELPEETLHVVAKSVDVRYFKAGARILEFGEEALAWYVVRSGAVEVFRRNGTLYNRLTEGGYFGEFGLLHRKQVRFPAAALEDTLVYLIPEPVFTDLFENNEQFADLVEVEDRTRLRQVVSRREDANQLMSATVDVLISREPVMLGPGSTAMDAARCMTDEGVSSLLIVNTADAASSTPGIAGIITDRDIRVRLVSQGLSYDTPVTDIMSSELVSVEHNQLVFEAMLQMLRNNVHHLPVL